MAIYLDNIEAHVETAAAEVERGRSQLGAAVRYKVCLYHVV